MTSSKVLQEMDDWNNRGRNELESMENKYRSGMVNGKGINDVFSEVEHHL